MAVWTLPSENQGAWEPGVDVGVVGGIQQYITGRTNLIDVTQSPYNADPTGATNCATAVRSAIVAASSGDVVYFPAGTYKFTSQVSIDANDSNITIRGAGTDQTFLYGSNADGRIFVFGAGDNPVGTNVQTVTGTKTKGTSQLTVSSSTGYSVGIPVRVFVEDETDNTRIIAGANPIINTSGYRDNRAMTCVVTAVSAGLITVDPPLLWDCTNVAVRIERGGLTTMVHKVGFEDFSFTFDPSAHTLIAITMTRGNECWIYNVSVPEWLKTGSNGSMVYMSYSYKCEIRHCTGISDPSKSDDGFIQIAQSSCHLVEDNIVSGWDNGCYSSGQEYNAAYLYNYLDADTGFLAAHDPHNSINLYEGNVCGPIKEDGYFGSASNSTYYRNWSRGVANGGNTYSATFKRFSREDVLAGNVWGTDGTVDGSVSYGQPNIGNASSTGTAEPTANDFWADWKMTGSLTTRTSDTAGVVTVSGGDFAATTGGSGRLMGLRWASFTGFRGNMNLDSRVGLALTVSGGSGDVLPAQGTNFDSVSVGPGGWQELDLDVEPSFTIDNNWVSSAVGTGSVENSIAPDTFPDSMAYTAKPAYFESLAWPPVIPDAPVFDIEIIPAGYRFVHGVDPPPPATGLTIGTLNITTLTIGA